MLLGRFVARGEADLLLGLLAKGQNFFKPGTVYEMVDYGLGQVVIREAGESAITDDPDDSPIGCFWGMRVNDIIERGEEKIVFTKKELERDQR